jgi:hypothetical protein
MIPRNQLIACIIRHYGTGLYRACVSLDKNNVICLSTYQDEASATEMINRFLERYQQEEIRTSEAVLSLVASICAPEITTSSPAVEQNVVEMAA